MENKYIVIIDHVGRNIIGKLVGETEHTITLNNPVILDCQLSQDGRINIQPFPLFFFEFINKDFKANNNWTYIRTNIVESDVVLDERVIQMWEASNKPMTQEPEAPKSPKIISINDL